MNKRENSFSVLLDDKTIVVHTSNHERTAEEVFAGIAHEIRNPLTAIRGFIQLLKPDLIEIGKAKYVDILMEEIDRTNGLISEYLGCVKPSPKPRKIVSVQKLIADFSFLFESEAIIRNVKFSVNFPNEEIHIKANETQIRQVLFNLVRNAFEAIEEKGFSDGEVKVEISTDPQFACMTVYDNGIGMDEVTSQKMSKTFFTTKENGTGIGLSISRKIIEEHGGRIEVKSQSGVGTSAAIFLPLKEEKDNSQN
ncbi:sensor histidine kinase [Mesobacillus zeae]|uniref:histidine kinase n=1 Tax=Mesobacillus zeae TaxID=1917180 RepID=A0A398B7K7_9BACI|nr:ATP-binding protein [Mesobacillus zeae]RID85787.1 GHKL domain-containing protein [Mesobacillus zeae]